MGQKGEKRQKGKTSAGANSAYLKGHCWIQRSPVFPMPGWFWQLKIIVSTFAFSEILL